MKKGKGMGCLFIIVALIFVGVVLFRFVLGSNSVLDTENSDYSQVYLMILLMIWQKVSTQPSQNTLIRR